MTPEEPPVNPDPAAASPEVPAAPEFLAAPPPERDPFWGYSDLLWFLCMAITGMLAGWAVEWIAIKWLKLETVSLAAGMLVMYGLLFGSLHLMFRVVYGRPFWRSLGWTPVRLPVMWVMICGMATAVLVGLASRVIHTPTGENPMTQLMETPTDLLVIGALSITMAPLCEELAFRGFLQPLLVRSLGAVPGILLAAVPFGLLHFQEYGNSWRHALIIAMAGVAFGCMRQATGSTKAAAIMHAAYNSLFLIALLTEKRILPHL
ncbi:MAG: type II CAAX endopeptidase family protein [Bryobacteraceae bacterium]|jgi:membrane protease YdiL (CAAX protease family)